MIPCMWRNVDSVITVYITNHSGKMLSFAILKYFFSKAFSIKIKNSLPEEFKTAFTEIKSREFLP